MRVQTLGWAQQDQRLCIGIARAWRTLLITFESCIGGDRDDVPYDRMNPLGRAICGEHTSTAFLLRRANAPFPEILQTPNHMTLGALCSAIAHGNVALVTYLFAQLRKRGEVDCDGEVISSYDLDRRDYVAFSVASFLGQCGDYNAVITIAGLIESHRAAHGGDLPRGPHDFIPDVWTALIHGNWLAACALVDALSDPLEYYDASEILQKLLHYENWTAQYWQFRPHYLGSGDEGEDYVREDSSTERERWLSKPQDVGFVAHTTNRAVDKLLEVFSARRARVTPHPMPIDLAPERFSLHELETLLVIPDITGNSDPHSCMENRGTISQRQALLSLSDGYFGGAIPTTAGVIPPSAIWLAVENGQRSDGKVNSQQHASKLQQKYANF